MSQLFYKISLPFLLIPVSVPSSPEEGDHENEIAASLITEGSWNMDDGKVNWENRMDLSGRMSLWAGGEAEMSVIATQNTRIGEGKSWTVLDDPQSFSNIQTDEQIPLSLALLGITQQVTSRFSVFLGVRNMNGDYFNTPLTSLFLNSSYGIYPTVADNWNISNYPESSLCFHQEWNPSDHITFRNSLYNGMSSYHWDKEFRFRPSKDGWINVFEVGYETPGGIKDFSKEYHLGVVCGHTPQTKVDENGDEYTTGKHFDWSVYGLVEQPLFSGLHPLGLLLQGGYAPKRKNETYLYFAAGVVCAHLLKRDDAAGLTWNRSLYSGGVEENCMELTYSLPVMPHLTVQPTLQSFRITGEYHTVALLRASLDF
ncbi:MAG: carbohydrate porin [Prevotella sp.]|jgi:porin|nr:carbohydrate porin [Prevotella sp.]MCH4099208.1 carbohydrate porin [Prevotella sp.]MCI1291663.1 carbohydrate porin [Prevotella sp.]MCI1323672.1 carbohydrate porin [Prevotella sp.]MCI1348882.1 carbohydrate porin [Prevotella sp.]